MSQDIREQMNGKSGAIAEQMKKAGRAVAESGIGEEISERYDQAKKMSAEAYETSIGQVKQNPITSLAAALTVGLVAGYFLARRK